MATLVLLIPLGAPSGASAAKVVSAKAVINSCGADQLAMTSRAKPKKRVRGRSASRRLRKLRRRIRGARLETRFSAFALFGGERRSPWLRTDRGGRASHSFSGLPADTWSGFVRFRWRKGGRTVASSFVNSSNGRVGGRRGRSLCSIGVGVLPRDTVAPFALLFPDDSVWRRPFTARIFSKDDFSGVAATEYRINGGRLQRGPNVPLGTEGVTRIDYRARDAAGNNSAFKRAVLRVDARAPSAPVVDPAPFNPTGDVTPTIRWNRSSDSASGVRRYVVQARNSAGNLVASRTVAATGAARQGVTLPALHSGQQFRQYFVRVTAVDGVERTATSASREFQIKTTPLYRNSFSTSAQCAEFVRAPVPENPFACADGRGDSIFPGQEMGVASAEREIALTRTWTATATRQFQAAAGQRVGVSLARLISLERPPNGNDDASFTVKIDGVTVLSGTESSAQASTPRRVAAVWKAPSSGNHTLEIQLTLTVDGAAGTQNANAKFFTDEIFAFLID